ncbi:hypothetical protein F4813DRAFT_381390 [Daldinia decipiens]|uniref:uncharacterized protein n=1 Tax=Daldinia decipiens TaxID=326647 RepID=UPI0020C45132|nr:uncharacterized protein F4813DRAFT_381390 [Daldinia decipiens]KAI1656519.1 hypothetical protein F4813DRAFT_381390 [Daldinia decipiens]
MATKSTRNYAKAREQGNVLYRKGRFSEASKEYQKAATLAPSDPSPLSNLSAVSFETGKYAECVDFAEKALSLLMTNPGDDTLKQKLLARQAKAYLQLSSPNKAEEVSNQLKPGEEVNDIRDSIGKLRTFEKFSPQQGLLRERSVQLPRLKPNIQHEPHYYGFGDDTAESQYTAELEKSAGKDPVLSIMFCGVSDARHVFHTVSEYSSKKKGPQKLHITMVDHKPIVLARILVFASMLHEAAVSQESKDATLLNLSYVYCAQIIPPFAWANLQETINRLLNRLEKKSWKWLAAVYETSTSVRRRVAESPTRVIPEVMFMFSEFKKRVSDYLDRHWKVNVTLLDPIMHIRHGEYVLSVMENHPFSMIASTVTQLSGLRARDESICCLNLGFLKLRGRLIMEAIAGDMAEPLKYHLIHMNNIPDYVGGPLTSFLYGPPVLKTGVGTGLTSCCLRHTHSWNSINHVNSEYLLMHDRRLIEEHFQVKLSKEPSRSETPVMQFYHRWERCESKRLSLERLMPRASFSKWLFAHYLKICIPFPRNPDILGFIAPLNMTAFLRLLVQMSELGYPGHWLSHIITSLSCGTITTTARAPRDKILDTTDVDKVYPSRTICVKPWSAEFTTIVAQWRGLLPFTIVVPSGILPPPETIFEYSVKIPHTPDTPFERPEFILIFCREYDLLERDLYKLLLDDERGDMTASAREIRADGVNIVSTIKYVTATATATFWLRSDVMDLMCKEDWDVFIGRTDSWEHHTPGYPVREVLWKKRSWRDCVVA